MQASRQKIQQLSKELVQDKTKPADSQKEVEDE